MLKFKHGGENIGAINLIGPAFQRDLSDLHALQDAFEVCKLVEHEDFSKAHELNRRVNALAGKYAAEKGSSGMYELYNTSMLFEAPHNLDFFMRALERKRPAEERFWLPRRKKLLRICNLLQDMEMGDLEELFLSCPPRVGKTTIIQMFLLWVMGRNTERSNLYCSFTKKPVDTFYDGLLEVLQDPETYAYGDIFPNIKIASTNAMDGIVDLNRKKKYASFTGRPIRGSLNGSCDCNGYVVGDDLCEGIEEALSPDRMRSLWTLVDNNLMTRAKESCKRLWIGTRWSLIDPQGIRLDLLQNDPQYKNVKWKAVNTPALNQEDESNFEYEYGVGFSTEYFKQRRASFERNSDMASWLAQYQGEPIEREGAVFDPADMRTYNGVLPEGQPDRVFMVVDPSWGGGDYVAGPVCVQYGMDIYVPDVVYNNGDKNITQPLIVNAVERHDVTAMKIEGTKMTAGYGNDIDRQLRAKGRRINMTVNTSHFTGMGKRDRIIAKAPDIRERMIFLQEGMRPKHYSQFMQNLYSFTFTGKAAKHDDAPDACAMVIDFVTYGSAKAEVMRSPFAR